MLSLVKEMRKKVSIIPALKKSKPILSGGARTAFIYEGAPPGS